MHYSGRNQSLARYFSVLFTINLFDNLGLSIDSFLYKAIHIHLLFVFAESKRGSQESLRSQASEMIL